MPGHLKMMGGDASAYGTRVYGAAGNQHAAPGGNVIAMNVGGGKMPDLSPTTVGGRRSRGRRSRGRRGGNILSDIALPATLMYANHAYGKGKNGSSNTFYNRKKSRKNRSRSSRRTYRR